MGVVLVVGGDLDGRLAPTMGGSRGNGY